MKSSMTNKCCQCGICCQIFLINLNEKEYRSRKYKTQFDQFEYIGDFKKAVSCGANILKEKKDGSCIYLDGNKCSIHKSRPQVCREFFCASKSEKYEKMIEQIRKKKLSPS